MGKNLLHIDDKKKASRKLYNSLERFRNGLLSVGNFFSGVGDIVFEQIENRNKFYVILAETNWPPPHDNFIIANSEKINHLIVRYKNFGIDSIKKDVDDLMQTWHSKEIIENILMDWKSKVWLKQRFPILQDAIQAHQNGLFTLSIPTLIPQIEGILVENSNIKGKMNSKKYKEFFKSLLHPAVFITNRNINMKEFIANTLLVNFVHGSGTIGTLSRHAITHGADIFYATKANSLRTILFINAINKLFRFVALSNSKIYHFNGCPLIGHSTRKRIFFASIIESNRNGYKICKRCGKKKVKNPF